MEKLEIKSGYNQVSVNSNLSGIGTTESPIGYTGDFQHADKRTLLWESTSNNYNTNITLSEPVSHFDKIMIYGSGLEAADTMHVSKNVYKTQDKLMGCDAWCYSPWTTSFQANYILAANLKISGNSGHIGGSMYWGIGSKNAKWAAGKWTGTEAPKMLMPWKIFGIDRNPTYILYALPSEGGSISSNLDIGYSGDIATITAIPNSDVWKLSALNITGAELTGNDFMFGNSNVTAQAEFEHSRDLTLENGDHGTLSADKMSGFSGDVVTVDATTDEGWYLSAIALTGAEATGFKFMFTGSDVTAEGEYTDVGFPITYMADEHVHLTGDIDLFIPGSEGITLQSSYDTYYRISGYDITNGSIVDGKLVPTGPCTVRAVEKVNYFTATGSFEATNYSVTSKSTTNTGNFSRYAIHKAHTGDIPASWYSTSNRWKTDNASAYKIDFNINAQYTGRLPPTAHPAGGARYGAARVAVSSYLNYNGNKNASTSGLNGNSTTNRTAYYKTTYSTTTQNYNAYITGHYILYPCNYTDCSWVYIGNSNSTWTATGIAP